MQIVVALAGWAGAIIILAAYALLSLRRIEGNSPAYHWLNLAGAVGIALNSGWNGALPSAALNIIWIGIAAYALTARSTS